MSAARYRARLLPDLGEAARSHDYFRSAAHLRAERVTHTLLIESVVGKSLLLPLVVRPIGGGAQDAISPYGSPGAALRGLCDVPIAEVDFGEVPLVSIFVRDRIGGPRAFAGGTLRSTAQVSDPARPLRLRRQHRRSIERNQQAGIRVERLRACEASRALVAEFVRIYHQTMARDGAAPHYYFDEAWFEATFSDPGAELFVARDANGAALAAYLLVESDDYLHWYLGGTADAALCVSPSKSIAQAVVARSVERGLPLNLGGGRVPGDALEEFKRGFANAEAPFVTHEMICDPAAYARLAQGAAETSFFPAYRAPAPQLRRTA